MPSSIQLNLLAGVAIPAMLTNPCSAVSHEAVCIQRSQYDIANYTELSFALFGDKDLVISSICEIAVECGFSDWDGYGAEPVSARSALTAKDFIRLLSSNLPMPEISAEPDGSLSLDWMTTRNRRFSVSIGSTDRLAYAWLDGTDRGHAVARFDFETVPRRVLDGIASIVK